jgi:hypothetical protein
MTRTSSRLRKVTKIAIRAGVYALAAVGALTVWEAARNGEFKIDDVE